MWGATRIGERAGAASDHFNPRAPCGARPPASRTCAISSNFNPRAPCGARLLCGVGGLVCREISIHAPRVGRDASSWSCRSAPWRFQSTRPVWGATGWPGIGPKKIFISIHAPRVGRDAKCKLSDYIVGIISIHAPRVGRDCGSHHQHRLSRNFNPRAPCGARRVNALDDARRRAISIHAPRVGRDAVHHRLACAVAISIHAPRVGRDM